MNNLIFEAELKAPELVPSATLNAKTLEYFFEQNTSQIDVIKENPNTAINIKNIVVDFGNVIFEYRHLQLIEYIKITYGLENGKDYNGKEIWDNLLELGLKTEEIEFFQQKAKILNLPITGESLYKVYFNFNKYFPEAERFIISLKEKGYNFYYLTNSSEINFKSRRNSSIFKYFDGGLASFECEYKKPDAKIYLQLFSKYNLKVEETVFLDDKIENIESANRLDIKSFRVESPKEFIIIENQIIALNY